MALQNDKGHATADTLGWFTIPNALSIVRLVLAPVVVWLILEGTPTALAIALVCMVLAEATDFFDGYIARSMQQETEIGRMIDPICDVIYHISVFLAFVKQGWMAPWILFVIYARDLAVPYIRSLARQRGLDIEIRFSGKVKTAVHGGAQLAIVGVMILASSNSTWLSVDAVTTIDAALAMALVASIVSLLDYTAVAFLREPPPPPDSG